MRFDQSRFNMKLLLRKKDSHSHKLSENFKKIFEIWKIQFPYYSTKEQRKQTKNTNNLKDRI